MSRECDKGFCPIVEQLRIYDRATLAFINDLQFYAYTHAGVDHGEMQHIVELAFDMGGVHARVTKLIEILQPKEEGSQ